MPRARYVLRHRYHAPEFPDQPDEPPIPAWWGTEDQCPMCESRIGEDGRCPERCGEESEDE